MQKDPRPRVILRIFLLQGRNCYSSISYCEMGTYSADITKRSFCFLLCKLLTLLHKKSDWLFAVERV
ncbi:hypothetical protein ATANTOWER_021078 [Ataeniobius toweri]|uniref:Uncharacterized protein n=1 Tax=Ataeniobius toweri TaxID=208326 RepID=A0ABU7BTS1_9TELE|nr:hypothetical protein [Ataeniobius toweri]